MDRDTLGYAAAALLGALAVALAAATLPTAVPSEGAPGPEGPGEGGGVGPAPPPDSPGAAIEIPYLGELLALFALVAAVAALWYLYHERRAVLGMLAGLAVFVALALVVGELLSLLLEPGAAPAVPEFGNATTPGGGGGDGDPATTTDRAVPPALLALLLGVALVGGAVALARRTGRRESDAGEDEAATDDAAAVGRAAGRAADRIEDESDVDNEIYRAWREMTGLLDLSRPDARTPGEFATAAVEAGMDPDDVDELTRLFEGVRYGDREPSRADERRAVAVFRRIESAYAEDDP